MHYLPYAAKPTALALKGAQRLFATTMPNLVATTKPGKKYRSIRKPKVYEALRRQGMSKQRAARISNAQAHKAFTIDQLETFVSSDAYDPDTASLIALGVPALPSLKGEQIAPGITRIHGNLCNVHGKYGPCDKALSGKPKGGKSRAARKPAKTDAQRATERQQRQEARQADLTKQQALNLTKVGDATDLGDHLANLNQFAQGKPLRSQDIDELTKRGLLEIGSDGQPRKSEQANVLLNAAKRGDVQGAKDAMSRASDQVARHGEQAAHQQERATAQAKRQADSQAKQQAAQAKREAAAKKLAKRASGGSKKPEKQPVGKPIKVTMPKRRATPRMPPSAGGISSAPSKPAAPKPEKAPAKQFAPALQEAAQGLSDGKELSDEDIMGLVRNGLAKLNKDGVPVLTAAGMRATMKAASASPGDYLIVENPQKSSTWHLQVKRNGKPDHGLMGSAWAALHSGFRGNVYQGPDKGKALSKLRALYAAEKMDVPAEKAYNFRVFKDASGRYRWVAQSSTAFQDRDKEIVSTKALQDDCEFADQMGSYGPLRWWHSPGLDFGECDFNAMHGRVLIESGTFKSEYIALKVAAAAPELEISLGFLHLPTEPDANGVFHHIRRFERSLVPRGKASNRFTAFTVKELLMLDATKVAALKALGFSDDDITGLQSTAAATEKDATDQGVAYKADEADEPTVDLPDLIINGVTYKAAPPMIEGSPEEEAAETPEEEAGEPDAQDTGGLTLSPEDISAIGDAVAQALQAALGPLVSTMDLTNKIGSHMDELKSMMGGYQTKKDAGDAEKAEQITALQTSLKAAETQQTAIKAQLDELLGLQPAVIQRPSESDSTVVNPWIPQDQQLLGSIKNQVPADQQFAFGDLVQNLFGNINTPGQA